MKRIILLTIVTLSAFGAFAQVNNQELAIIQSNFQKDKADLVKQSLKLSDAQSQAFWPIYQEYETKRLDLSTKRSAIVSDYLKQFDTLTGEEATALVNRTFASDKSFLDLQKSYFKKFAGAIGGKNAAKLLQLEVYLQEIVRLHVQDKIPFIGELKRKHK